MNETNIQIVADQNRHQLDERIARAKTLRLADHLPTARRHRFGLGLSRRTSVDN